MTELQANSESGICIFENEIAAMQPRDSGSDGKTKARPRLATCTLKTNERSYRLFVGVFRNTGPTVFDDNFGRSGDIGRPHHQTQC